MAETVLLLVILQGGQYKSPIVFITWPDRKQENKLSTYSEGRPWFFFVPLYLLCSIYIWRYIVCTYLIFDIPKCGSLTPVLEFWDNNQLGSRFCLPISSRRMCFWVDFQHNCKKVHEFDFIGQFSMSNIKWIFLIFLLRIYEFSWIFVVITYLHTIFN